MEQHPIPQQIASYQFKLVGDMTLKQFVQLAGGILVSLLLYASPLHPFIKWPLIIVSFLFGVALAFLPIEDRPLSTWIISFFRSIYSPTYFVWNKSKKPVDYFLPEETSTKPASVRIAEKKEDVQELLEPVVKQTEVTDKLEEKEKSFLSKLSQSFIAPNTTVVISTTPVHTFTQPSTPAVPQPVTQQQQTVQQPVFSQPHVQSPEPYIVSSVVTPVNPISQPLTRPTVIVPNAPAVGTTKLTGFQQPQGNQLSQQPGQSSNTVNITPMSYQKLDVQKTATSQFSNNVIPPPPATRENVVVGQVLDTNGQLIEGAILEIKDLDGRPVRALRSNKLGHFTIATPLIAGEYVIQTEKDGFDFEPYRFKVENKIIPPIAIWAKTGNVPPPAPQMRNTEVKPTRPKEEQEFMKDFKL